MYYVCMYVYIYIYVCVCVCVGGVWEWGWRRFGCMIKRDVGQALSLLLQSDVTSVSRAPHTRDRRIGRYFKLISPWSKISVTSFVRKNLIYVCSPRHCRSKCAKTDGSIGRSGAWNSPTSLYSLTVAVFLLDGWYTRHVFHICLVYLYSHSACMSGLLQWKLSRCCVEMEINLTTFSNYDVACMICTVEQGWSGWELVARLMERHIRKTMCN